MKFTDNILKVSDKKRLELVALHFSKAFDTIASIGHQLLCMMMKTHQLTFPNTIFLRELKKISSITFWPIVTLIASEVPQRSILGPLPFVIYTADWLKNVTFCNISGLLRTALFYIILSINDNSFAVKDLETKWRKG